MWSLEIISVDNGYILTSSDGREWVIENGPDGNEFVNLSSGEALLWEVMEFFNFGGSKHDNERIRIVREKNNDL